MSNVTNLITNPAEIGLLGKILNYTDFNDQAALKATSSSCRELFKSKEPLLQFPQVQAIANLSCYDITKLNNHSPSWMQFSVPMYKPIQDIWRAIRSAVFGQTQEPSSPSVKFFSFPIVKKFHEKLDPNGEVLGRYLTKVLQVKCEKNPKDMIAFLQSFSLGARETIHRLSFDRTNITDEQVSQVLNLCPNLTSLNLSFTKITGEGLRDLPVDNKLKILKLNNNSVLNEEHLMDFLPKANNLEFLDLSKTNTTGEGLSRLSKENKLHILHLNECNRLNERHLGAFFTNAFNLSSVSLTATPITGEGISHLPINNQLKNLYLHSCEMLNLAHLTTLFEKTNLLEIVYLIDTNINLDQPFRERFAHISFY
ncbi:MAG: hypothetical protein PVI40_04220 [Chlamydiota bacterium]|jgi:hypothetical protein